MTTVNRYAASTAYCLQADGLSRSFKLGSAKPRPHKLERASGSGTQQGESEPSFIGISITDKKHLRPSK